MMNNNKQLVVGIDLGGTNTVFGLVDENSNILNTLTLPTQEYEKADEFTNAAANTIRELTANFGGTSLVRAIGIGAPCGNFNAGTIEHAANLKWGKGIIPVCNMLKEKLGIAAYITNDAKAAALGEMKFGAAKGMKNFIEITLGTGVGSGIVANGRLIYGCDGFAGELGHTIIDFEHGRACGCGRRGCLDMYCSSRGIIITAKELLERYDANSSLKAVRTDELTTLSIFNAAEEGDRIAQEVFRHTGELLGKACANFATFLSPEAFIFFGGVAKAGDWLLKPAKEAYDKYVLSLYKGKAKFLTSGLKDGTAAVLGAAALAWESN